jgi:hypothetical protein
VFRLSVQQIQRVRNQLGYSFQGFNRAVGAPWHIQDQGLAANSANCPTERCEWSLLRALNPHVLAYAWDQAIADRFGRLRRNVSFRNSGSPGGYDEPRFQRKMNQGILNLHRIILHHSGGGYAKP